MIDNNSQIVDYEEENDNFYYKNFNFLSPHNYYLERPNGVYKEENFYSDFNLNDNKNDINTSKLEELDTKLNSKKNDKENQKQFEESDKLNNLIQKTSIEGNLESIEIKNEEKKAKKKCGRKRKRTGENKNEHNKFSDDNLRRKCKHLILKYIMEFINLKIKILYNWNIGNGIFKKELQTLNQSQKSNATIDFNKLFLLKKLGDIFSEDISGRFTNYPPDHNKILIQKLLSEKDEEKKIFFNEIFNLQFIQCLKHFRGEEKIDILEGLKCFSDIKNDIINKYEEEGVEYYEILKYYLCNFEIIINNKKARKIRKQSHQ